MSEPLIQWYFARFWPACLEQSGSPEDARITFMRRIEHDRAWHRLDDQKRSDLLARLDAEKRA